MNFEEMKHYPLLEDITNVLIKKTQSNNPSFYRVLVAYNLAKIAGMMSPMIKTLDRGSIPINVYAVNLAPSGFSKGFSTNMIETQVINNFKRKFMKETFPIVSRANLLRLAEERAVSNGTLKEEELEILEKEFKRAGKPVFSFSEGTSPATKQLREMSLLAGLGALNLEIDEIGSNLVENTEVINTYLELYDIGKIKPKLTKNTQDNVRGEELDGMTPANMMLYGTPDKLMDDGKIEEYFLSMLETGYARRCLFSYIKDSGTNMTDFTPEEILNQRMNKDNDTVFNAISEKLGVLAEPQNHGKQILVNREVTLELIKYELLCAERMEEMPYNASIKRAEMKHRYFKAMKIAGAYAFVDESDEITMEHLHAAIKLVEESGRALHSLLNRDRPHVKLAKYLALQDEPVTQSELMDGLSSFKGTLAAKNEQIIRATEWGYKNNVVIKKSYIEGIELLSADSLKETDLDKMILSISKDVAFNYKNVFTSFDNLHSGFAKNGFHWSNHHFDRGHRKDENAIRGFNLIAIDIDGTISLENAKKLLSGYKCFIYTTKRHTEKENRFRIIFPTNYVLNLDKDDYKAFMKNVYSFLPFEVDDATCDRPRKWMTNDGHYEYLDGELFDVLPFIPKTTKAIEYEKQTLDMQSMDNLERWFMNNTGSGNRSNQLVKYALMLVDSKLSIEQVREKVLSLNNKLKDKLSESEINSTIMKTVESKYDMNITF